MIEVKTKLRRWGNSFGVVVPQKAVENINIKEGDDIIALIRIEKEDNILKKTFGSLKVKKSTDKIMREIDKELDINF